MGYFNLRQRDVLTLHTDLRDWKVQATEMVLLKAASLSEHCEVSLVKI